MAAMHIQVHGRNDANAPTLVFSSGLGGAAAFWTPQLSALGRDYRVVLYDQAGTGRSPAELPQGYSIADMARELDELLVARQIDNYHLIGHALGGLIGLTLAMQQPAGLRSLTLMNAWASPSPHTARCFSVRQQLLAGAGPAAYIEAQALFLYPPDWIAEHIARLDADDKKHVADFPPIINLQRRISALLAFRADAQALARIAQPVLLVANRDDMLVPWHCSQQLLSLLPNARLTCFDYGGHASSVTCPDTINRTLTRFLDSVINHTDYTA